MTFPAGSVEYLLFFTLIVVGILVTIRFYQLGRKQLDRWASENGLRLLSVEQRWLRAGPFTLNRTRGQLVYYVTVVPIHETNAQARAAFVRVGHWLWGTWTYASAEHWET